MEKDRVDQIVMSRPTELSETPPSDSTGDLVNGYLDRVWAKKLDVLRSIHREDQLLAQTISQIDSFISVDELMRPS